MFDAICVNLNMAKVNDVARGIKSIRIWECTP